MKLSLARLPRPALKPAHFGSVLGAAAAVVTVLAGLSTLGILPRVGSTPGARAVAPPQSTTATPSAAKASGAPAAVSLPAGVNVLADDQGATAGAAVAAQDVAVILDALDKDYRLTPSGSFTVYVASTEAGARNRMQQLGTPPAELDGFFNARAATLRYTSPSSVSLLVYLPVAGPALRPTLALETADYLERVIGGGWQQRDAYPYWFLRGFELLIQNQFGGTAVNYRAKAAADARAGNAPSLATISTNDQVAVLLRRPNGGALLDDRSEVTLGYLAQKFNDVKLGLLLKDNAFGSVSQFTTVLQRDTGLTPAQLEAAVDAWLSQ